MREKCVELHESGIGHKKIATRLKMPVSTVGAILKKFKAAGTVPNLPGRGPMFIWAPRTVRKMIREAKKIPKDHCWRITEESSILGSSSLPNYIRHHLHLGGVPEKSLSCYFTTKASAWSCQI